MLISLAIRNFILIDNLVIDFHDGLCVLSGETGAGKSIILDALGLAIGAKANSTLIKDSNFPAIITAEFDITLQPLIIQELEKHGIISDTLIVKRILTADAKTKIFINDTISSITQLIKITTNLVEICGQHEQQGLLNNKNHLNILDEYAELELYVNELQKIFTTLQTYKKQLNEILQLQSKEDDEISYLENVIKELAELAPQEGELEELANKRKFLLTKSKISESIHQAMHNLTDNNNGVLQKLYSTQKILLKFPYYFTDLNSKLESSVLEIEEVTRCLEKLENNIDDTISLEAIEKRLFEIQDLARKYNILPSNFSVFLAQSQNRLGIILNTKQSSKELNEKISLLEQEYIYRSKELSTKRQKAASILQSSILNELKDIKMDKADFKVEVTELSIDHATAYGINNVSFLIRTNPGSQYSHLNKIASGGELSRIMLACKIELSNIRSTPCIIFDEIDSGIGGAVSNSVGKKLATLAKKRQVIVVTHQPQVAAYSHNHYAVIKNISDNQTNLDVILLTDAQKEQEIARMLSGDQITKESIAAAKSLINKAHNNNSH